MCDMGGLDNLIANTAYLQARKSVDGDAKEMLKRRRSLSLPSPDQCAEMRQKICVEFESVCEQQPIGKRFFRQFTQTVPEYQTAVAFLDELNNWELAENTGRDNLRQNIATSFLKPDSKNFISYMSGEVAEKCKNVTEKDFEEVMALAKEETRKFLMGKPFQEFQSSGFFDKFMQWKVFERQPITEKYFYEFRILGKGGFGEVCAIQVKVSGQMYACKKLDKKRLKKKKGDKMALLEKEILEKVNSPFIVKLAYAYESKTHLCLVMSLMNGGDLKYHIYNIGKRDMKPENVLLDDNGQCMLSDLGLAVEIKEGKQINQKAGTSGYMAPEILNEENYTHSVDWFALGCSIYEMIAGRTPFKDFKEKVNKDEVKRRCLEDEVKFEHANFDEPTKDICKQFLVKKVEERLGCRGANDDPRKHPWFKSIQFHRLEAGLVDPPFVPDPSVVYAKEIGDIADFSEIRGIEFDDKDKKFFKRFATGAVPIPWQEEMIESGLFDELNDPSRKESKAMAADTGESKLGVCLLL